MALRKHKNLLPGVFQTPRNEKFLNATIDQLNSEPNNVAINQFVGRKASRSFLKGDSYIQESTVERQNYQLEPAVVYRNSSGAIENVTSLREGFSAVRYNGGVTTDQNKLSEQEYYNYSGWVDIDKMINYGEYFWLPKGPDLVNVGGDPVDPERTYEIVRSNTEYRTELFDSVGFDSQAFAQSVVDSTNETSYYTEGSNPDTNPTLYLARGGTYKFDVNQPGFGFYIQTEIGTSGISASQGNINTREVEGVVNNGEDIGVVTFNVPEKDGQNFYQNLPYVDQEVSFATDFTYSQLHNVAESVILAQGGIDFSTDIDNKTIVFATTSNDVGDWEQGSPFDGYGFDDPNNPFDETKTIDINDRYAIYRINVNDLSGTPTIQLTYLSDIPQDHKVRIKQGTKYASREFYKNAENKLELVPPITAPIDQLYYQDSSNSFMFGKIVLVDLGSRNTVDVVNDIIGQSDYTAPNGVVFTNGLKIELDSSITPAEYQNRRFYVEGVGQPSGICLVPEEDLSTPESYTNSLLEGFDEIGFDAGNYDGTEFAPTDADYILINRASRDNNSWSRYNRWFHKSVIEVSAAYNNFTVNVDQNQRAKRPIIEFKAGLQLWNHGTDSKQPVDIYDSTQTDALSNVNGKLGYFSDGIDLDPQHRIIFSADTDPAVRNTIYRVDFIDEDGDTQTNPIINLVPVDTLVDGDGVVCKFGIENQGKMFYLKDSVWVESQQRTGLFQDPLFDVFDYQHKSLGDTTVYPDSTFAGCKMFNYKRDTTVPSDTVLGFGIKYKNFNNIGDIVFDNFYITDKFRYTKASTGKATDIIVKSGHAHILDYNTGARSIENGWKKIIEPSKSYQVVSHSVDNELYSFEVGAEPANSQIQNLKVYVNGTFIQPTQYTRLLQNKKWYVIFDTARTIDDTVTIKVYSNDTSEISFYEVPTNLENNANNSDFDDLTLGQARNHMIEIAENIPQLDGIILGSNNLRDIDTGKYPGKILQHSSGAILPLHLLGEETQNIIESIKFSSSEYTRFKNRFSDLLEKLDLNLLDAPGAVDTILETLVGSKTNIFPFYYSDMLPWGERKTLYKYTLDNTVERFFEFGTQFDLTNLSQRGVIVYLTNSNLQRQQLLYGRDYTFDTEVAGIHLTTKVPLAVGDVLDIQEYDDTDGSFVPPTPTKLGLWPKWEPSVYLEEVWGYDDDTGPSGPYKVYGTLDPEYDQIGATLIGFSYPLYTNYDAAAAADSMGMVHIHKFVGTDKLFYMPGSADANPSHGQQDDSSINQYPGVRTIIRGHDGSRYVGFGDVRDSILVELESRMFNNIKTNYDRNTFDWADVLTGYSRSTSLERNIELNITRNNFGTWAEKNRVDTINNTTFNVGNRFSWNYSLAQDAVKGLPLPGGWRGIFYWLYDTDSPHLTPWELLGIHEKPTWWDQRYGMAPYTSGNLVMWEDLRDGKLYNDAVSNDFVVLEKYKRPDLLSFIPVDQQGQVRPPADFAGRDINVTQANNPWKFGDWGPAETAWRHSSEWPFTAQILGALRRPAKYMSLLWDANLYVQDNDLNQLVQKNRTYRPTLGDYRLHGVADENNVISRREGYNQFIFNYLIYHNYSANNFETRIRNLELNLCYSLQGFSDKKFLKVIAENATPNSSNNNIFIPDEDYDLFLQKSIPLERVVYSGVRIIKDPNGYKIAGYDNTFPFFKVIPTNKGTNRNSFVVGDEQFVLYEDGQSYILNVPYGTVLNTKGQVIDFLNSLQRYYTNRGISFSDSDNFISGAKEFVFWTQQNWDDGSVFTSTPGFAGVTVNRQLTTLDNFHKSINIRDVNGQPIDKEDIRISRIDNVTKIEINTANSLMGSALLSPIQYEHIIVLKNKTIFNDLIYQPELGNRQERLKLIGEKTGNWNGTLHAPGYIISNEEFDLWVENRSYDKGNYVSFRNQLYVANQSHEGTPVFDYENWDQLSNYKSGLLKNLATRSSDFENYFDTDVLNLESDIDAAGKGLIGFRNREWLENLGLDDVSQVKFYQGMIKEKGTSSVINKLINANLTNLDQEIDFYEEWGFRVGEYGSIESNQVVEIEVDEALTVNNPITIEFLDSGDTVENQQSLGVTGTQLLKSPTGFTKNLWKTRTANTHKTDLDTVGYPRLDDVDYTVVDISFLKDLEQDLINIGRGDKIWVGKEYGTWNMYRINETESYVTSINTVNPGFLTVVTDITHNLAEDDIILIKTQEFFGGFYRVSKVLSNTQFQFAADIALPDAQEIDISIPIYKLSSVRFDNLTQVSSNIPRFGYTENEMIWVDYDESNRWAAYEKHNPWSIKTAHTSTDIETSGNLGTSVAISTNNSIALGGAPNSDNGRVIHYKIVNNELVESSTLKYPVTGTVSGFGAAVASGNDYHVVGAPTTNSNSGAAFIYSRDKNNELELCQVLCPNQGSNREFGYSIAISHNENYIIIGAPGVDKVYLFAKTYIAPDDEQVTQVTGTGATTYAIGFTPVDGQASNILVQSNIRPYIPKIDYDVSGSNIIFTSPLNETVSVTQKTHYRRVGPNLEGSNVSSGDRFGHSVDIDAEGRTVVIGSPYADIADSSSTVHTDAGEVYVYTNTVEAFIADGTSKTYTTNNTIQAANIVTVDEEEYVQVDSNTLSFQTVASEINNYKVSGNDVTFSYAPPAGSVVRVFTGILKETQIINQDLISEQEPTDSENFGYDVSINTYGSSIAIGCPGEDETNPNTGSVFVFTDTGLRNGIVNTETTLHSLDYFENESFFINDFEVTATADDTDIQQFISDIDLANIAGVTASNRANAAHQATISTTATKANARLRIRPGTGALFDKVAVTPFVLVQQINQPNLTENENFGKCVAFDKYVNPNTVNSQSLVLSSDRASTLLGVGFDIEPDVNSQNYNLPATTFDADGTLFIDRQSQSGAAYVYEFSSHNSETITDPAQWLFAQSLTSSKINSMDEFGRDVAINNKLALVGSSKDDESSVVNSGSVYEFVSDGIRSWTKKRTQVDKVDISLFNKQVTYSKKEQEIKTFADYVDPWKLKVAGKAQQEIDYLTDFDPASYSQANSKGVSLRPNSPWGKNYVGKVWWDLNSAMFIDYEQGNLDYRTQYWGRLFPGAQITCYEWVESTELPQDYTGDGEPRSLNEYSIQIAYDPTSNRSRTHYYYWVTGKESIPNLPFRSMSTNAIERLITDPVSQGVPHLQYIAPNALNMVNFENDLNDKDTVLSINYDRIPNEGVLHSEFELVSKGNPAQIIPSRIYNKIVDSVSGIDVKGNVVPNPNLSEIDRYGISIRPRQTVYRNKFKALQVFIDYCNKQFLDFPVVREAMVTGYLNENEAQPTTASNEWDQKVNNNSELSYISTPTLADGYKVLVNNDSTKNNRWTIYTLQSDKTWSITRTQSYKTSEQWTYRDWYAPGFNEFTVPLYQVNLEPDLLSLTNATAGEVAKVLTNDDGNTSHYEFQADGTWKEVIIGNGTIQFNTTLYTDYNSESTDYPQNEVRALFNAVNNDILIDEKSPILNDLFFRMVEYALDEQSPAHPDWVLKTSFIRVNHKLRDLNQYPTFRNDNSEFVENFINEVKPYKTKIRDYTTRYEGNDKFESDTTDFDVHAFYDENLNYFRKPSGDYAGDEITQTQGLNQPWGQNYTYYIDSIEIYNSGAGYIVDPIITISAPDVEGGIQATATARTNGSEIIAVDMTNKGSGYTTIPTVTITGSAGTGLFLIPRLKNDVVREFDLTIKFDRISYNTVVKDWKPNTVYNYLDLVMYKKPVTGIQEIYQVSVTGGFTSGNTFSAEIADGTVVLTVFADEELESNADRIAAYYNPSTGMIGDDLNLLQIGTDYTGVRVKGVSFDQNPGFDTGGFDAQGYDAFEVDLDGLEVLASGLIDTNIRSQFTDSLLGTRPEDINVVGGEYVDHENSHNPEEVVPGLVFDTLDLEVYTNTSDDFEYDGNSFNIVTRAYVSDGITDTFSYASAMRMEDVNSVIVYCDGEQQHDVVVDYYNRSIQFTSIPDLGKNIYIYGYNITGEKLTHEQVFVGDGVDNFMILGVGLESVEQQLVVKNGLVLVENSDYVVSEANFKTIITFTQIPAVNDYIHVFTSRQDQTRNAFTQLTTQEITLTSGTNTYALDNPVQYVQPLEGAVVAVINDLRLRPTNSKHYIADGSTVTYSIPTTAGEASEVLDGSIRVSVISRDDSSTLFPNENKTVNIDYTVDITDGSSARTITFYDPPSTGDTVIVSVRTGSEYTVSENSITITDESLFTTGDKLYVTSFGNHNPLRPQTQVFVGLGSDVVTDDELFDESGFDSAGFDETSIAGVSVAQYSLDRAVTKNDYLWVTLDGVKLHPGQYTIDEFGRLDLTGQTVSSSSEIVVTSFSEEIVSATVGFRIFKDMLGGYNYYRICDDESTIVTQDVSVNDTKIYVEDASKLPYAEPGGRYPGTVFVGNERITYWEINTQDNYITGLRRGTRGTRHALIHRTGVAVIDASEENRMPATNTHTNTWYNTGVGVASDGNGIQSSNTINGKFLKSCQAVVQNYTRELDSPEYVVDGYVEEGYFEEQLV